MRAIAFLGVLVLGFSATGGCRSRSSGDAPASAAGSTTAPTTSSTPAPTSSSTAPTTPPVAPPPLVRSSRGSGGIAGVVPGQPRGGLALVPGDARSRYAIYVPSGPAPLGLVIALHGVEPPGPDPTGWFTACVAVGNQDRFVVVAPYGDPTDGGSGAWAQPFARDLWEHVRARYDIDDRRQYVAAISGGCLPAIWLALATGPPSWKAPNGVACRGGFQAEIAAIGLSSPAYTPQSPDFAGMTSRTAAQLGFKPALFTDWGELSTDGSRSRQLADWAAARGYGPVENVVRPGEGHAPRPPFAFVRRMFDLFAAVRKP